MDEEKDDGSGLKKNKKKTAKIVNVDIEKEKEEADADYNQYEWRLFRYHETAKVFEDNFTHFPSISNIYSTTQSKENLADSLDQFFRRALLSFLPYLNLYLIATYDHNFVEDQSCKDRKSVV